MESRRTLGSKGLCNAGVVDVRLLAVFLFAAVLRLFSFPAVSRPAAFLMVPILVEG
jgi:glucan phosphoethanolaminetransferase (alkaline phosphatase superfamily)